MTSIYNNRIYNPHGTRLKIVLFSSRSHGCPNLLFPNSPSFLDFCFQTARHIKSWNKFWTQFYHKAKIYFSNLRERFSAFIKTIFRAYWHFFVILLGFFYHEVFKVSDLIFQLQFQGLPHLKAKNAARHKVEKLPFHEFFRWLLVQQASLRNQYSSVQLSQPENILRIAKHDACVLCLN